MRDERTQAAGPFPQVKGSRVEHAPLREFIHRNYAADEHGAWYFQNGPQRVYVELEAAPWVWRLHEAAGDAAAPPEVVSHTGRAARFEAALLDERGRLFLATDLGLGLVHPLDMYLAAAAVEAGHWPVRDVLAAELPQRYRFRPSPQAGLSPLP